MLRLLGTPCWALFLLGISCRNEHHRGTTAVSSSATDHAALHPVPAGTTLVRCSPSVLHLYDTLLLSMSTPHGEYLVIVAPDSTLLFVVYPQLGRPTNHSLVPSGEFRSLPSIRLVAGEARALPWVYGRDTTEQIFGRSGHYTVFVGDELETDADVPVSRCGVEYVAR